MRGRSGQIVLLLFGVGCFSMPLVAWIITDDQLGFFLVTLLILGPLAVLLSVGGGRDDGRRASSGFARRAPALAAAACASSALGLIAAAFGNPAWLVCLWLAVFLGAGAHAWGSRPHRLGTSPKRQEVHVFRRRDREAQRRTAFPAPPAPGQVDSTLSMAVLVYLGVGISSFPTRLPDALDDYVGATRGRRLRARVDELLVEADLSAAEWGSMNDVDATRRVEERMRVAHPELSEDAVRALGWNFSFTYR